MRFIKEVASTIPCLLQPLDSLSSSPGFDESRSMQLLVLAERRRVRCQLRYAERRIRHEGNGMSHPRLSDGDEVKLG